jgi:hypothetical protein
MVVDGLIGQLEMEMEIINQGMINNQCKDNQCIHQ